MLRKDKETSQRNVRNACNARPWVATYAVQRAVAWQVWAYNVQNRDIQSCCFICSSMKKGVPRRQPHRRSGLATLPSVGAIP